MFTVQHVHGVSRPCERRFVSGNDMVDIGTADSRSMMHSLHVCEEMIEVWETLDIWKNESIFLSVLFLWAWHTPDRRKHTRDLVVNSCGLWAPAAVAVYRPLRNVHIFTAWKFPSRDAESQGAMPSSVCLMRGPCTTTMGNLERESVVFSMCRLQRNTFVGRFEEIQLSNPFPTIRVFFPENGSTTQLNL